MAIMSIRQNIGIFCKHMEYGERIFDKLISDIPLERIVSISKSKSGYSCYLSNGDIITTVQASDNSRGCKFTKVFMEPGISDEIVNCIIKPSIMFTCQTVWESDLD